MNSLKESQAIPVNVDFVITFPTANHGNEHAKKNGVYYAAPHLSISLTAPDPANELIIDRIEAVAPGYFDSEGDWYIYANEGETFDDFSKRLLYEYKEKLAPISETPPTHSMQTTGRYQWLIHLKIKPIKK